MSGGYGKIKPEDGKQFQLGNKAAEIWTETRALELGEELLFWLREEDENMFLNDFIVIIKDHNVNLANYLSNKFSSFNDLLAKAKIIQETKLVKFGVLDRLNSQMTKFVLINNHNWKDKQQLDVDQNSIIEYKNVSKQFPDK